MRGGNKFNAKKTHCAAGHLHDSKIEAGRCDELMEKEREGLITHLRQQPRFTIAINGRTICTVILDFEYRMADSGLQIDEDVKGRDNPVSRLKRKLIEASYPGTVVTVWPVKKRKTAKRKAK